jgi:hypothetical protein
MAPGYIYILTNPSMPGLLKIGKTTNSVGERAAELSSVTGIPTPFVVEYQWNTSDCDTAEARAHKRLAGWRCNQDREFFRLPLEQAINIVSEICEDFAAMPWKSSGNAGAGPFSTCAVSVVCGGCHAHYTVTMKRYEHLVVCPRCYHAQSYQVNWEGITRTGHRK